jgi:hypothetical protein
LRFGFYAFPKNQKTKNALLLMAWQYQLTYYANQPPLPALPANPAHWGGVGTFLGRGSASYPITTKKFF